MLPIAVIAGVCLNKRSSAQAGVGILVMALK
jgi:hypothetical protein